MLKQDQTRDTDRDEADVVVDLGAFAFCGPIGRAPRWAVGRNHRHRSRTDYR